jgi:hypothetical protein
MIDGNSVVHYKLNPPERKHNYECPNLTRNVESSRNAAY